MYFSRDLDIEVGALGKVHLKNGVYVYVGSARAGLWGRVQRHLGDPKRKRWHIDHIANQAEERRVEYRPHHIGLECSTATDLSRKYASIGDFGCSDCRCGSHLFFLGSDHQHYQLRQGQYGTDRY